MELELKYLSGYLPYGLNGILENERIDFNSDNIWVFTLNAKPLLRPLSDLTKEIEIDGKKFVPIIELGKIDGGYEFYKEHNNSFYFRKGKNILLACLPKDINQWPLKLIQKLYEWHFDLHNLIGNNLAININDL